MALFFARRLIDRVPYIPNPETELCEDLDDLILRFAKAAILRMAGVALIPVDYWGDVESLSVVTPNQAFGWDKMSQRPRKSLNEKMGDGLVARIQVAIVERENPGLNRTQVKRKAAAKLGIRKTTLEERMRSIQPMLWDQFLSLSTDELRALLRGGNPQD